MIKITQADSRKSDKAKVKSKKKLSSVKQKENAFTAELQNTVDYVISGTLEELMDRLDDQGKRFLDSQSIYELNKYKVIVQKILKTILDEGFKTKTLKRKRRDRADFTTTEIINRKLLDITTAITRSNKAFDLLKAVEEIRGLVFDLVY